MFKAVNLLKVSMFGELVGRMINNSDDLTVFEYDANWLKNGFPISPFYLPLKQGIFTAKQDPFNGIFGVFNDSLPDGWGNLLIDRLLMKNGVNPKSLSIIDRLSIVGKNGMGALSYEPDNSFKGNNDINDLLFFAKEVEKILKDEVPDSIELLVNKNGSSGGARPKVLLNINGENWLIKFPNSLDSKNIGQIEYKYSLCAKQCGIEMPETKLFEKKYFGVKRFDKQGAEQFHVHTASGLLYADYRLPSLDYIDLGKATWALTQNIEEVKKIFRLMIFNVLTGNKDDHSKNFSFIYKSVNWKFAPAYDLTPSYGINNNHSTTIAGKGNPLKKDVFEVAKQIGISLKHANKIFDEVYENCKKIRITEY